MSVTYDMLLSDLFQVCDAPAEHDRKWFALETAVGQHCDSDRVSYGREVYGGCLEPGYCLENRSTKTECPECGRWLCGYRTWESVESGSINTYYSYSCDACGHYETDWSEP